MGCCGVAELSGACEGLLMTWLCLSAAPSRNPVDASFLTTPSQQVTTSPPSSLRSTTLLHCIASLYHVHLQKAIQPIVVIQAPYTHTHVSTYVLCCMSLPVQCVSVRGDVCVCVCVCVQGARGEVFLGGSLGVESVQQKDEQAFAARVSTAKSVFNTDILSITALSLSLSLYEM